MPLDPVVPMPAEKPVTSRDLISTGSKDVHISKHHGKRGNRGTRPLKPTTERALVLRDGKHGIRGTGELALTTKMSGREKLDLLAEDLVEKSANSLLAPFCMETCLKMAESQLSEHLNDIANLRDPELFHSIIENDIKARSFADEQNNEIDPRDPSFIAGVVSDRIHNVYMLGSAWKIIVDTLYSLKEVGLTGEEAADTLKNDSSLRSRYLALYDLVNILVELSQRKFSVLAATTPHYSQYFKETSDEAGETQFLFDGQAVRSACRSFLDSIIVELCFPQAPYPQAILYQILHDAVDESPRNARRFPQALWDAVGDLSVAVQLRQVLETPLLSPDAAGWKGEAHPMPEPYHNWLEAQLWSEAAAENWASFEDIFPLQHPKTKDVLDVMWTTINSNYRAVSGKDVDTLWALTEVLKPTPHWHTCDVPKAEECDEDDGDGPPTSQRWNRAPLAFAYESDDSLPSLQSVTDSDYCDDDDNDSSDSYNVYSDDELEYDTDEEEEARELLREAMDAVHDVNWDDPQLGSTTAEDRRNNPFLKVLGSLRGRMFSKNTRLKTATGSKLPSESRKKATSAINKGGSSIEEVPDEDDRGLSNKPQKKTKKKKPKKKKPTTSLRGLDVGPEVSEVKASSRSTAVPEAQVSYAADTPEPKSKVAVAALQSAASFIPLEAVATAQSARSYLRTEQLDVRKQKIKSRPDFASSFTGKTMGLFEKLGIGKDKQDARVDRTERRSWFANMNKKTRAYMHQILNTAEDGTKGSAGMKWDTFVKVLTDMGFTYVPSTAGSSVRFDPPSRQDRSISFHKPHPDSTISPILLKEFSKKLQRFYGWTPADVMD